MTRTLTHRISVRKVKGLSRHGRMKTNYQAVCSCGWADPRPPIGGVAALEHGDRHIHTATHIGD